MKDATAATFQEHTIAISRPLVHEINNALTGVLTFSKLAARKASGSELLPREFAELMARLEASAQRSAALAKALLQFLPKAPLAWERVNLAALVEKSLTDLSAPASLRVDLDLPHEPVAITACPDLLSQALRALVANAVEAALDALSTRPPRIGVRLRAAEGAARIRVEDSGPGIPRDLVDRIFDPFVTTKASPDHLGLGLHAARGAARLHGGDVHLESADEAGSRFVLWIPLEAP